MSSDFRLWGLIILIAGLLDAVPGSAMAQSQQCQYLHSHYNATKSAEAGRPVCSCDDGFAPGQGGCNPVSPKPPINACLANGQLKLVDARIANLKKVIAVVGDPERFRTDRERVIEDMKEDAWGVSKEGINLVTLGLARGAEELSRLNVLRQEANAARIASQVGQISHEEWQMSQVLSQTKDVDLAAKILNYRGALAQVRIAEQGAHTAEMVSHLQEAGHSWSELRELHDLHPLSDSMANKIYMSSTVLGSTALIFVEGPGAAAAVVGSIGASILIGGGEIVNAWQDLGHLNDVYQQAANRDSLKNGLIAKLGKLQQQRAQLAEAVRQAGPANCR
jgi:hypothetical protein